MSMLLVVLLLSAGGAARAAGERGAARAAPAFLVVGMANGTVLRCPYNDPETCETIVNGGVPHTNGDGVFSIFLHGTFLFMALKSKKLLRCEWDRKDSCSVHFQSKHYIYCLTVSDGYLYAGTGYLWHGPGRILRCGILQPDSCSVVYTGDDTVISMYELNKYMYVATHFSLSYCSVGNKWLCTEVKTDARFGLWSVTHMGNIVSAATLTNDVTYYNISSSGNMRYIRKKTIATDCITTFNRKTYLLDFFTGELAMSDGNNFTPFVRHEGTSCFTFVYSSHAMARELAYGVSGCSLPRASAVFSYGVEDRRLVSVRVVDGLLRDARGAVDTRRADRGYSGRAAVFAMGLDGQLLLSDAHGSGLLHISSLLAGGPAAGAGEIHVENGVVKKIVACSTLYKPNVALNSGASYADSFRYQRCIDLWTWALEIRLEKDSILYPDTCHTACALTRLLLDARGALPAPPHEDVVHIAELLMDALPEAREWLVRRPVFKKQADTFDRALRCLAHLLHLMLETASTDEERAHVHRRMRRVVELQLRSAHTCDTLLHLSVSRLTVIRSSYCGEEMGALFPSAGLARALLAAGADPLRRNTARCTALHVAVLPYNFSSPLVEALLAGGAHLDQPNKFGDSARELLALNAGSRVRPLRHITLACLAARALLRHAPHLVLESPAIPGTLTAFLDLHRA